MCTCLTYSSPTHKNLVEEWLEGPPCGFLLPQWIDFLFVWVNVESQGHPRPKQLSFERTFLVRERERVGLAVGVRLVGWEWGVGGCRSTIGWLEWFGYVDRGRTLDFGGGGGGGGAVVLEKLFSGIAPLWRSWRGDWTAAMCRVCGRLGGSWWRVPLVDESWEVVQPPYLTIVHNYPPISLTKKNYFCIFGLNM